MLFSYIYNVFGIYYYYYKCCSVRGEKGKGESMEVVVCVWKCLF